MINFDMSRFTSDKLRLFQLFSLAGVALFGLLSAFADAKILAFLLLLSVSALLFFSLVPLYFDTLSADRDPLPRSGRLALRGAEAAGLAGVAITVMAVCLALGILFGGSGPTAGLGAAVSLFGVILILLVQAMAGLGIAAGVGLSNMLRQNGVELEAPAPPPQPVAQDYAQGQGYQQPPQQYQQPQQGYQQPQNYQQQYPPGQGGGYNQGGQGGQGG